MRLNWDNANASIVAARAARQDYLNDHAPPPAVSRTMANTPHPIPVMVRVVWERDGETWIEGEAVRWSREHVFVEVRDVRCNAIGVWVAPADVRRR